MRTLLIAMLLLTASISFARAQNGGSTDISVLGSSSSPPSCSESDGGRAPCATQTIVTPPAQVRVEYHNHVYYVPAPRQWRRSGRHRASSKRPPTWAKRYRHESVKTLGVLKQTTQATLDQARTNTKVLKDIRATVHSIQKDGGTTGLYNKIFWTMATFLVLGLGIAAVLWALR